MLGHLQAAKALDRRDQAAKALEGYQAAIQFYLLHLQTPSLENETRSEATLQVSLPVLFAEMVRFVASPKMILYARPAVDSSWCTMHRPAVHWIEPKS